MKKAINYFSKHKHILAFIIMLLIDIILAILLLCNENFDRVGSYKQPTCMLDFHTFKDEDCESCGNNIMEFGILRGSSDIIEDVRFKEMYKSYEDYKKARNSVLPYSVLFVIVLLGQGINILVYFVNKHLEINKHLL